MLCEAFVRLEGWKAKTHECLFAYLCERHPELGLDWDAVDRLRQMRNRSLYYGEPLSFALWRNAAPTLKRHIAIMARARPSGRN